MSRTIKGGYSIRTSGARHAIVETQRSWIASSRLTVNLLAGDKRPDSQSTTLTTNNGIGKIAVGEKFSFNVDDLFSGFVKVNNGNPHFQDYLYYKYDDAICNLDTRFYIRNYRTKRFVKTISPVLRLAYYKY